MSENSDPLRHVLEKDDGAIEFQAQIELEAETKIHVGWRDRSQRMMNDDEVLKYQVVMLSIQAKTSCFKTMNVGLQRVRQMESILKWWMLCGYTTYCGTCSAEPL